MNSPQEKKGRRSGTQRTKAQILEELDDVQALLSEKDGELALCRETLAKSQGRIDELEIQQDQVLLQLEDFEEKQTVILASKDEDALRGEIERLKQELQKSEEWQQELECENQDLETQLKAMQQKLASEQKTKEPVEGEVSTGKSTFRLELYPHEDMYRARITHFQSEEQDTFDGADQEAIFKFINSHSPRPKVEESVGKREEEISVPAASVTSTSAAIKEPARNAVEESVSTQTVSFRSFDILSPESGRLSHTLPRDKPCKAHIVLDLKDTMEPVGDLLKYKVIMYARRLDGGPKILVTEEERQIQWEDVINAELENITLPAGTYRLETSVLFSLPEGIPLPINAFLESGLIHVQ